MSDVVMLKSVGKSFGKNQIFFGASFNVARGTPTVLMGSNGCGKSTLLKIIVGDIPHSEGEVVRDKIEKISYMPDRFAKLPFTVEEYLQYMGQMRGMTRAEITRYVNQQFVYFDIPQNILKQKILNCSKGTIQKVNIMQAFLQKSDLLVMDEPFSGLDEKSVDALLLLIKRTIHEGVAVVLSCHESALAKEIGGNLYVFSNQEVVRGVHETAD